MRRGWKGAWEGERWSWKKVSLCGLEGGNCEYTWGRFECSNTDDLGYRGS